MWSFPAFESLTDIQASRKATYGNVPHVQRLQRFQNPCDDDIREHAHTFGVMIEHQDCLFVLASSNFSCAESI